MKGKISPRKQKENYVKIGFLVAVGAETKLFSAPAKCKEAF